MTVYVSSGTLNHTHPHSIIWQLSEPSFSQNLFTLQLRLSNYKDDAEMLKLEIQKELMDKMIFNRIN